MKSFPRGTEESQPMRNRILAAELCQIVLRRIDGRHDIVKLNLQVKAA